MGYTVEYNGTRRYKLSSKREVISPKDGEDFYVDRVASRLGHLAYLRGRIFHPVDTPDEPLKVHFDNGWSAPAAAYYGTASAMASRGVAAAVFDVYHPPRPIDKQDPLHGAETGALAMIDIVDDVVGKGENARIGHSTGAVVAYRVALKSDHPDYVIGQAPVGVQHKHMDEVYKSHLSDMSKNELYVYIKSLVHDRFGAEVAAEFMALNATNPTRLLRQAWFLLQGPDLAPMWAEAHGRGMLNGLIFFDDDRFFHLDDQLEVMNRKADLVDDIVVVPNARHLHPNMHPVRDAKVRIDSLRQLQRVKKLGSQSAIRHFEAA